MKTKCCVLLFDLHYKPVVAKRVGLLALVFIIIPCLLATPQQIVYAQNRGINASEAAAINPKTQTNTVTATVGENEAPSPEPLPTKKPSSKEAADRFISSVGNLLPVPMQQYFSLSPLLLDPGLLLWTLSVLALILLSLPIISSLCILISLLDMGITLHSIRTSLQIIGLFPWQHEGGLVFETTKQRPLSYAQVLFIGVDTQNNPVRLATITNSQGIYPHLSLPEGDYRAHVRYPETLFPTRLTREDYVPWYNFYQNTTFEVTEAETEQDILIPVDLTTKTEYIANSWLQRMLANLRFLGPASVSLAIISLIITIMYPSVPNITAVALYGLGIMRSILEKAQKGIIGSVLDANQAPVEHAIVRFTDASSGILQKVAQTNENGQFKVKLGSSKLRVQVVAYGLKWDSQRVEQTTVDSYSATLGMSELQTEPIIMTLQKKGLNQ